MAASALGEEEEVLSADGEWLLVESVSARAEREVVYGLTVEEAHSYFVGEAGIWVHNASSIGPRAAEGAGRAAKMSPAESPIWKGLSKGKGARRTTGAGKKQRLYEWDYTHGDIEVYDSKGRHLGSMHPSSGEMYKPAVKGRKIDL